MRGWDYTFFSKREWRKASVRSGFKILRHVFTKAMHRLDSSTDYRSRTDVFMLGP